MVKDCRCFYFSDSFNACRLFVGDAKWITIGNGTNDSAYKVGGKQENNDGILIGWCRGGLWLAALKVVFFQERDELDMFPPTFWLISTASILIHS